LATTAFVKDVLENYIYPVGSIYINAAVATNPGTLLGFGTWAAYAEGRVPVGKASSGTFDTLDATGGAETDAHELTTAETPAHTHSMGTQVSFNVSIDDRQVTVLDPFWSGFGGGSARATGSAGSGSAHSHSTLQPSVTLHIWKRTA
jgi:microcystin-dependent protein